MVEERRNFDDIDIVLRFESERQGLGELRWFDSMFFASMSNRIFLDSQTQVWQDFWRTWEQDPGRQVGRLDSERRQVQNFA